MELEKKTLRLWSILLQKEMLLVFTAAFLVMINVYNSLALLPLYVTHQGGSEFEAGMHSTIFTLATVILRFYLGPMADTHGRKMPLLIGSFVFMTAPVLIWLAPSLWLQALVRVYHAIGMATFLSSATSQVADLVPGNLRGTVLGVYRMVLALALMVGPPVGIKIIGDLGYDYFFGGSFLIGAIAFMLLYFLPNSSKNENAVAADSLANITAMLREPSLSTAYTGVVVISVCYGVLMTYLSMYAKDYAGIANPGVFFTFFAASGALATVLCGYASDLVGRIKVIIPSVICLAIGVGLLALLVKFPGAMLLAAVFSGIGFSGALSTLIAWVVDNASENLRGTALALQENAIDGAIAVSAFIFGLATVKFEFPWLFLALGLLTLFSPLILVRAQVKG